jgi:dTDP-4-dehydrorhamnose 3,5-epimerase and related enzymes
MDKVNIDGVILMPLDIVNNPKGDILCGLKKSDPGFIEFGEAYFSTINHGQIKGWNKHNRLTMNLIVPYGEVAFVIFDNRPNSPTNSSFFKTTISSNNYNRLTIPPNLWVAFRGIGEQKNIILNIASQEHDSQEIERMDLKKIQFDWHSL